MYSYYYLARHNLRQLTVSTASNFLQDLFRFPAEHTRWSLYHLCIQMGDARELVSAESQNKKQPWDDDSLLLSAVMRSPKWRSALHARLYFRTASCRQFEFWKRKTDPITVHLGCYDVSRSEMLLCLMLKSTARSEELLSILFSLSPIRLQNTREYEYSWDMYIHANAVRRLSVENDSAIILKFRAAWRRNKPLKW